MLMCFRKEPSLSSSISTSHWGINSESRGGLPGDFPPGSTAHYGQPRFKLDSQNPLLNSPGRSSNPRSHCTAPLTYRYQPLRVLRQLCPSQDFHPATKPVLSMSSSATNTCPHPPLPFLELVILACLGDLSTEDRSHL